MGDARKNKGLASLLDEAASRWIARPLLAVYRRIGSPAMYMLGSRCRFSPSCGHYAEEAFRRHGFARGLLLSSVRVAKCNPLHPGGHDPVPPFSGPEHPSEAKQKTTRSAHNPDLADTSGGSPSSIQQQRSA